MANMPNTKVQEHTDSKKPVSLPKQDHPPKMRGAEKPMSPSGG
jgi:hypothetical protein